MTFESMNPPVDLQLFLMVAMILSLLRLAKSVMQATSFMNQKAGFADLDSAQHAVHEESLALRPMMYSSLKK